MLFIQLSVDGPGLPGDRLERIALKLSTFGHQRDGQVVADDFGSNLVHDFRNDRIDLARHDVRTRLH